MATDFPISPASANASSTSQNTEHDQNLDTAGYCLLALDGGGVRGLSTLYILQNVMNRLNYMREEAGLQPKKPCEIFDLIGGTSTGGLIAIMLGRLEMSVDECIKAYLDLMTQIFEKRENRSIVGVLGGVKPRFSSAVLKEAIAKVIKDSGRSLDEKFEDGSKPRCKVFVCTNLQATSTVTRLRNYRTPSSGCTFHPTILEAALATSAAPTYFSDISIKGSKFVDGAIGANNPTAVVEEEASDLWCEDTGNLQPLVKCFISIGTGHLGVRSVSDKGLKHLVQTLQKEATQTDNTNEHFIARWRDYVAKGRCFRFNVDHGLENVKLAEFKQQDLLQAATTKYLRERDTMVRVRTCVENLRLKKYQPTIEFAKKLRQETRPQVGQKPSQASERATPSEIAELITLGTAQLNTPSSQITQTTLLQARHYFSKALHYLQNDDSASPKQVSRACQKLMEASLMLSQVARAAADRREYADQAQAYGEVALENVTKCSDECMAAQMEFLLACVVTWKMYLRMKTSSDEANVGMTTANSRVLMDQRLENLRRFPKLNMERYEEQAQTYMGYLTSTS